MCFQFISAAMTSASFWPNKTCMWFDFYLLMLYYFCQPVLKQKKLKDFGPCELLHGSAFTAETSDRKGKCATDLHMRPQITDAHDYDNVCI